MSRRVEPEKDWAMLLLALVALAIAVVVFGWQRAEAGPHTRVFEALNETVGLTEWTWLEIQSGASVDDSSIAAHSIGRGIYVSPKASGAARAFATKYFGPAVGSATNRTTHARFYWNPATFTTTTSATRILAAAYSSTRIGFCGVVWSINYLDIGTTFQISVYAGHAPGAITTIEDTLGVGWHRFDVYSRYGDGDGQLHVFIDGELVLQHDTLQIGAEIGLCIIDSIKVGLATASSTTNSGYMMFDDVVVDTTNCPPPCGIEPVKAEYGFSSPFGGF